MWPQPIASAQQPGRNIEASARELEQIDDIPPIAMLIVILAGVAITSAIIAFVTFPVG